MAVKDSQHVIPVVCPPSDASIMFSHVPVAVISTSGKFASDSPQTPVAQPVSPAGQAPPDTPRHLGSAVSYPVPSKLPLFVDLPLTVTLLNSGTWPSGNLEVA